MADEKGKDAKKGDGKSRGKRDRNDDSAKKISPEEEDKAVEEFLEGIPEDAKNQLSSSGRAAWKNRDEKE
jgi:hypothetical protein